MTVAVPTCADREMSAHRLLFLLTCLSAGFIVLCPVTPAQEAEGIAPERWTAATPVAEVLIYLGERPPAHYVPDPAEGQIRAGEQLVLEGRLRGESGAATPRLSAYFRCTDCHNVQREDPDLTDLADPDAKLAYAVEHGIPLLQASTFAGMVNRESWYNGDNSRKHWYSLGVLKARSSLKGAIEHCCSHCAQGRKPEDWEMEAMLAYFWSLQWTIGDLGITAETLADWRRRAAPGADHEELIAEIKSHYATRSPATFGTMPDDAEQGFPMDRDPDPAIGEQVFRTACLHCHDPAEGAAETWFRDDERTRAYFKRRFPLGTRSSVYGHIRLGTRPDRDEKLYMPNFTMERLSDYQIESLRAFLCGTGIDETTADSPDSPR